MAEKLKQSVEGLTNKETESYDVKDKNEGISMSLAGSVVNRIYLPKIDKSDVRLENTIISQSEREMLEKANLVTSRSLALADATLKRLMVNWADNASVRPTRANHILFRKDLKTLIADLEDMIRYLEVIAKELRKSRTIAHAISRYYGFNRYQKKENPKKRGRKPKSIVTDSVKEVFGVESEEALRALVQEKAEIFKEDAHWQMKSMQKTERELKRVSN